VAQEEWQGNSIALAQAGANVNIIYASKRMRLLRPEEKLLSLAVMQKFYKCNVADEKMVEETLKKVIDKFGKIDILVNNAGINRDTLLLRMSVDDWESVMETNLKGAFLMTKYSIKYMIKGGYGRIINIGSVVGLTGNIGQANYAASKAGLIGFTKAIAIEYGSRKITSNLVAPGYIETEMTGSLLQNIRENFLNKIVLKRSGKPEDVANVVLFLASPLASYITGDVIVVDGGLSLT